MNLDLQTLVNGGALMVLAWFCRVAISAKSDLADYKLHVAENYLKKDGIEDLNREVRGLRSVVYRIAGKMGIPISEEE
jgi:hypothetical protein